MSSVTEGQEPVSSVRKRPGNDGVALLVICVARLKPSLGWGGAVAHTSPLLPLLLVVVLQYLGLSPILQRETLQRKHLLLTSYQCCYKVYLVGQIPPVSARICGDEVDPLLLQGIQRLGDMVCQVCGILSEVPLKVRPRVGLVAHGDLVVAGVNWRQVGDGIPASESPPRCAWSFGGCAVVAAVQRYLLEVRSLQKDLKCSQLKFKNHPVLELAPPQKVPCIKCFTKWWFSGKSIVRSRPQ